MDVHRSDAFIHVLIKILLNEQYTENQINCALYSEICVRVYGCVCSILILILRWRTRASHLLILFPPRNTNQKIVTAKLNASILRKDGSDWKQTGRFKYPGFNRLLGESQVNYDPKNDPYFSLCLIPTAEKTTHKSRSRRSLSPSLKSEPSRGPLNRFSNESFLWVGSFEWFCRIGQPIRESLD